MTAACFYMGPNDTTMLEQVNYDLGDQYGNQLILCHRFLDDVDYLHQLILSGHYKLSNRTTNNMGKLIPLWLLTTANAQLSYANYPLSEMCDHIYFALSSPDIDKYKNPFLMRKFRGTTYIWCETNKWWCLAAPIWHETQVPCVCKDKKPPKKHV